MTNPAVIGGVGTNIALRVLNGEEVEQTTLLTPEVWDLENNQADLEANYFPDRDDDFSSAVTDRGLHHLRPPAAAGLQGPRRVTIAECWVRGRRAPSTRTNVR